MSGHWSRETAFVLVGAGILLTLAAGVVTWSRCCQLWRLTLLTALARPTVSPLSSPLLSSPLHSAQPAQYAALQWILALLTQDDPG